jgi:hypothetical protein
LRAAFEPAEGVVKAQDITENHQLMIFCDVLSWSEGDASPYKKLDKFSKSGIISIH